MDDLERRIIHLEHSTASDRQLTQIHLDALYQRLAAIETSPWRQMPLGAIFRILAAIALPIAVWLLTGDLAKALRAFR